MRQLKKKSGTESVNDSSSIPRISTPSPCHTQSPSQQGPEALSQPQGHETPPQQGQGQQPKYAQVEEKKVVSPLSNVWEHFTKKEDGRTYCKYYNALCATTSSIYGTSNLRRHMQVDKKQKAIVFGSDGESDPNKVSMKLVDCKQEQTLIALAKMIIIDELAFKFVENEGFRKFMKDAQPKFKILSHEKLKHVLFANKHGFTYYGYLDINSKYELHVCETIGRNLENYLKEWGISKVCCVTVNNASANNLAISYFARALSILNGHTLLNEEFMHMRCSAHILNLIVSDGLKEIDISIRKKRVADKFVKSSPSRFASFKRWNSTYLMLYVAEKYEHAFFRYEYVNATYVLNLLSSEGEGCPKEIDWQHACVFISFLKTFYDATLFFSESLHVTANTFFKKLGEVQKNELDRYLENDVEDDHIKFYILNRWKLKASKYYILSYMARDILVIHISIVSSESAFNT
ncbi:hypothetical protein JHK85_002984 [Glycine max]|uniref:BED-type domain-containing protein n=1 Tax=Glycine max TaxID=3847 RepID=A0A0R0KQJ8_SOYBN|nr:hypothetical protein JHK85_002984 [Glycine max]